MNLAALLQQKVIVIYISVHILQHIAKWCNISRSVPYPSISDTNIMVNSHPCPCFWKLLI